jgi:hypothetical protein
MFVLLVLALFMLTLFAAGGFALGKAFPTPGVVLAGVLAGLLSVLWWYVLRDGLGEDPVGIVGLIMLLWLSAFPMLFVVGVASGAWDRPELTVGVWVGTVTATLLMSWSPTLAGITPLVFGGLSAVGGKWRRAANAR